jgi:hypothetical protein
LSSNSLSNCFLSFWKNKMIGKLLFNKMDNDQQW